MWGKIFACVSGKWTLLSHNTRERCVPKLLARIKGSQGYLRSIDLFDYWLVCAIFDSLAGTMLGRTEHEEVSAGKCSFTQHRVWVRWTCCSFNSHQEHTEESQFWSAIVLLRRGECISSVKCFALHEIKAEKGFYKLQFAMRLVCDFKKVHTS